METVFKVIATVETDFPEKFGLPRQSGVVKELKGRVIFEPPYRDFSAVRELSEFSHIWLIWGFSKSHKKGEWSPTVRPPRLGGNERVGVFATRSPYRPNPIALSAVRLEEIENNPELGPVLHISGIDMTDGTPIYDIKPYIAYADAVNDAVCGFADKPYDKKLEVELPNDFKKILGEEKSEQLIKALSCDPRPRYQSDADRTYGLTFAGFEIKFKADGTRLYVTEILKFE